MCKSTFFANHNFTPCCFKSLLCSRKRLLASNWWNEHWNKNFRWWYAPNLKLTKKIIGCFECIEHALINTFVRCFYAHFGCGGICALQHHNNLQIECIIYINMYRDVVCTETQVRTCECTLCVCVCTSNYERLYALARTHLQAHTI